MEHFRENMTLGTTVHVHRLFLPCVLVNRFGLTLDCVYLKKKYPFGAELSAPFGCLLEYLQMIVFLEDFILLEYTIS